VHSVENPSFESELALLRNFGPSLPEKTLRSVVRAFAQLRSMADQGQLSYPYSTREVINVVKHLEVMNLIIVFCFNILIYLTPFNSVILMMVSFELSQMSLISMLTGEFFTSQISFY
jgi:hypothetical protein